MFLIFESLDCQVLKLDVILQLLDILLLLTGFFHSDLEVLDRVSVRLRRLLDPELELFKDLIDRLLLDMCHLVVHEGVNVLFHVGQFLLRHLDGFFSLLDFSFSSLDELLILALIHTEKHGAFNRFPVRISQGDLRACHGYCLGQCLSISEA